MDRTDLSIRGNRCATLPTFRSESRMADRAPVSPATDSAMLSKYPFMYCRDSRLSKAAARIRAWACDLRVELRFTVISFCFPTALEAMGPDRAGQKEGR